MVQGGTSVGVVRFSAEMAFPVRHRHSMCPMQALDLSTIVSHPCPTGQVHWKAQVELMDETREAVREFGVTRQWRPWRQNQSGCLADIIDLMVSLCWLGGSAYSPNYLWFERDKVFFVAFTSSSSSPTSATTSEGED